MRTRAFILAVLCLALTQGVLFAELYEGTSAEYETERRRREEHLLAGPCGSDYQTFCPDEPVISGRRAVWTCLSQHQITTSCKRYLMRIAPDLFADTPLYQREFGVDYAPAEPTEPPSDPEY